MSDKRLQTNLIRCGLLTAAVLILGLLLAVPAYSLGGLEGLEGLSYAAALCLLPGWVVIAISDRYGVATSRVTPLILGMGVRFGFILGGVFLVTMTRPELGMQKFLVWVVVFYMVTLAFETGVLLRDTKTSSAASEHSNSAETPAT